MKNRGVSSGAALPCTAALAGLDTAISSNAGSSHGLRLLGNGRLPLLLPAKESSTWRRNPGLVTYLWQRVIEVHEEPDCFAAGRAPP